MQKNQITTELKNLKKLIDKEKSRSKHPHRVHYSKEIQNRVAKLTQKESTSGLCRVLGVSSSFISRLKKKALIEKNIYEETTNKRILSKKSQDNVSDLQFMEIPCNVAMDTLTDRPVPVVKMVTSRGLTIEIFE